MINISCMHDADALECPKIITPSKHRQRVRDWNHIKWKIRISTGAICSHYAIIYATAEISFVGSLRDREVACSASDRQGSNFESCVWRTVSSQSSHHPQEVLLAQFSLYVHKGGLKPDLFHFIFATAEITEGCLSLKDCGLLNHVLKYSWLLHGRQRWLSQWWQLAVRNSALTKKLPVEFCLFLQTWPMCLGNSSHIFFLHQAISGYLPRWPPIKACGHHNLWTVGWIAFKFGMVVL